MTGYVYRGRPELERLNAEIMAARECGTLTGRQLAGMAPRRRRSKPAQTVAALNKKAERAERNV